jgi:hypothetical protein
MEGAKRFIKEGLNGMGHMSQPLELAEPLSWDIVWEAAFTTDIFYHPYLYMGAF